MASLGSTTGMDFTSSTLCQCEKCEEEQAVVYCVDCTCLFCTRCDAENHRGKKLSAHKRVPPRERPLPCEIHTETLTNAFCKEHQRAICEQCVRAGGECVSHSQATTPLVRAVESARKVLKERHLMLLTKGDDIKTERAHLTKVVAASQAHQGAQLTQR